MSLFSIHPSADGSFKLFLEERDANLDLLEDVMDQVPLLALARLRDASGRFILGGVDVQDLERAREAIPTLATQVVKMTEREALDLAEELLMSVKFARAIAGKPMKLELVK